MFLRFVTNLKDYHDLYLKCDVLLLAVVFEKFMNNSTKNYGLRPSYYLSAPALCWDALLNMTKVKLKLISDPDMHVFFDNRYSICITNNYLKS